MILEGKRNNEQGSTICDFRNGNKMNNEQGLTLTVRDFSL